MRSTMWISVGINFLSARTYKCLDHNSDSENSRCRALYNSPGKLIMCFCRLQILGYRGETAARALPCGLIVFLFALIRVWIITPILRIIDVALCIIRGYACMALKFKNENRMSRDDRRE